MRIIVLGDSFSFGHWSWPELLKQEINCSILNFAIQAAQNPLQIQLLQDWMIQNDFQSDDIVIWTIGWSWLPSINLEIDKINEVEKYTEEVQKQYGVKHYHFRKNILDNKDRISILHISPVVDNKTIIDEPESIQTFLFMTKVIKKLGQRILIFRAKDDFISDYNHWLFMKDYFLQNQIEFIEDSIVDWCKNKQLEFYPDNFHPTRNSMHIYTKEILIPKLKSLGWI